MMITVNKKGLIFTIDAILAFIIAISLVSASMYHLSKTNELPFNKNNLVKMSQDSLTVLEKGYTLKDAIESDNNTVIQTFLNNFPSQFCGRITIHNTSKILLLQSQKTNCTQINETVVSRRLFEAYNKTYYAEMKMWYDGE